MIRSLYVYGTIWGGVVRAIPWKNKVEKLAEAGRIEEAEVYISEKVQKWALSIMRASGCDIQVYGEDRIPADEPVLFVGNHQGNFDIPILLGYIKKPKGFIAKVELEKLPLISDWMKLMHCVFIDRTNVRQSVKAIGQGVRNLKKGHSMVLFPEGTRSPDGHLGEFKPGGLKLATKSGVSIVPVTLRGSKDIMKKGSWRIRPAKVDIVIGEPIPSDIVKNTDTTELSDQVRAVIAKELGQTI